MTLTKRRRLRHTAPSHLVSLGVPPLCIRRRRLGLPRKEHRTLVLIKRTPARLESTVLYDGHAAEPSGHRCFEVTTPAGHDIRIRGDPQMSEQTLAALMRVMDLAYEQFSNEGDTE